jgi:uncharacterized protein YqeY
VDDVVTRMRADLTAAMRARDRTTTAVLRSALGAVANAEAVPAPEAGGSVGDGPVAGAVVGVGSTEAARRVLSADDVAAVLRAERDERLAAADQLAAAGSAAAADELRATAALLETYLR